jgi:hypothetical protein
VLEENILGKKLAELGIIKDRLMKNKKRQYYYLGITTQQALRGENETLISAI